MPRNEQKPMACDAEVHASNYITLRSLSEFLCVVRISSDPTKALDQLLKRGAQRVRVLASCGYYGAATQPQKLRGIIGRSLRMRPSRSRLSRENTRATDASRSEQFSLVPVLAAECIQLESRVSFQSGCQTSVTSHSKVDARHHCRAIHVLFP